MTPEPHDEKACRHVREQLASTAENLSVTNLGIAAAIRELERLRKESKNLDASRAFGIAVNVIHAKIQNPSAHITLDIPDFEKPEARAALETIAGMRAEYAMQGLCKDPEEWVMLSDWMEEMPPQDFNLVITDADKDERWQVETRIVVRYVTEPQPLGETK